MRSNPLGMCVLVQPEMHTANHCHSLQNIAGSSAYVAYHALQQQSPIGLLRA